MEIVTIFAESLYAIQFEGEIENEYERLMDLWTDVSYLYQFLKDANVKNIKLLADKISEEAECIQDFMAEVDDGIEGIDSFFKPFHNQESGFRVLSLQKGRPNRKSTLRLYAIKIDKGIYLIAGGAIKLVATTQESEELMAEWQKMKNARNYLINNGVFDSDSFQDLKREQDEN